jgi:hypothetical protein
LPILDRQGTLRVPVPVSSHVPFVDVPYRHLSRHPFVPLMIGFGWGSGVAIVSKRPTKSHHSLRTAYRVSLACLPGSVRSRQCSSPSPLVSPHDPYSAPTRCSSRLARRHQAPKQQCFPRWP